MDARRSSTLLPATRRRRRRLGTWLARALCGLLALVGLVPFVLALLVRMPSVRARATNEALALLRANGVEASFDLEVSIVPLSVALRDVRVESVDGGPPAAVVPRAVARPRIFGLLAGKVVIDQIELESPDLRVVLEGKRLVNLGLDLPETDDTPKKKGRLPFSVIAATNADLDVTVEGQRVVASSVDVDVVEDDDGAGGSAFEVALRAGKVEGTILRPLAEDAAPGAVRPTDEDVLCRLDARARVSEARVIVRRLAARAAVDFDAAAGTRPPCDLPPTDPRLVELDVGHLAVTLPGEGRALTAEGRVRARAPLRVLERLPGAPDVDGWALVDVDLVLPADAVLPELKGRVEAHDLRVTKFNFAEEIVSDVVVRQNVVTSSKTTVRIARGLATLTDVEVKPLAKGIPLRATVDVERADFTELMKELGVSDHPHVEWFIDKVRVPKFAGTLDPLVLDGDLTAQTRDFAIYDAATDDPARTKVFGVPVGNIQTHVAVRPIALEFHNARVTTRKAVVENVFVQIGFHELLRVEAPKASVDLAEISPVGSVAMAGQAEVSARLTGGFSDPKLEGDGAIKGFVIGDLPLGDVERAHASLEGVVLTLSDVVARKGKSVYEMPTGRLDFGGAASMQLDAHVSTPGFELSDFLSIWRLDRTHMMDQDPRFADFGGRLAANATLHLALGGPEDRCGGGYVEVAGKVRGEKLLLAGEAFDDGDVDFELKWRDRDAGIAGAEIDLRALSLYKVRREGRAPVGSVLGSATARPGGELRGSFVVDGVPLSRLTHLGGAAGSVEGSVSGVARLGGTLSSMVVDADLSATPVRVRGSAFGPSRLQVQYHDEDKSKVLGKTRCGGVVTAPFELEAFERDTSKAGEAAVQGELFGGQIVVDRLRFVRQKMPSLDGKIRFERLDLGAVARAIDAPRDDGSTGFLHASEGVLTGALELERLETDAPKRARVRFVASELSLQRSGQRLSLRPGGGALELADDRLVVPNLTFDVAAAGGLKGAVVLGGSVARVTSDPELDLAAEVLPFDLGVLAGTVPRVTRSKGRLAGRLVVRGKAAEPRLDGRLTVRGGEFGVVGVPGVIGDVEADVVADGDELRVARAVAKFAGGDLSVVARMPLRGGTLGNLEGELTARQVSISQFEGVKAVVDADLKLEVPTRGERLPHVGGGVTVTSFEYTRPVALDLANIRGSAKRPAAEVYDPALDAVTFGIDVRARAPLRFRNNLVEAQLAIDPRGIQVTGSNQRVGLRGQLASVPGGRVRLFANEFEIQRAEIRFDDPTRIAPHVDLVATTDYRRYTNTAGGTSAGAVSAGGRGAGLWRITLHAYGDADDLRVDMTSDPALSQEDIFFLLTIGLTRAEVDQVRAGSVYASAAFEAIGTVSGADRAVKQAFPVIDDFRFGSAYSPRTGRAEPTVTVGRRVTENVRASVSTGLTEDRQLRSNIELRLSRPLSVQTSYDNVNTQASGNVGNFGVDLRWRLEFE